MLFKKELVLQMIKDGLESCTLVGRPTAELQNCWFLNENKLNLLQKYDIEYELLNTNESSVNIWFPKSEKAGLSELCIIRIIRPNKEQVQKIMGNLFIETLDIYQSSIKNETFLKVIGLINQCINLTDILYMINKTKNQIAQNMDITEKELDDILNCNEKLNIYNLSKLMNLYPLLPWSQFIEDISRN